MCEFPFLLCLDPSAASPGSTNVKLKAVWTVPKLVKLDKPPILAYGGVIVAVLVIGIQHRNSDSLVELKD